MAVVRHEGLPLDTKIPMKIYHPPLWQRVFTRVVFGALLAADVATVAAILYAPDMAVCLGVMIAGTILPLLPASNLYPSIGVAHDHLDVYTIWGTRKSIPWSEVTEVRPARLFVFPAYFRAAKRRPLIVKARNIGLLYRFNGVVYDGGGQGFFIHPGIRDRAELLSILREKCPTAFHIRSSPSS